MTVRLSLDSRNVQHEKLVFQLVKPYIKGFSAELTAEQSGDVEMADAAAANAADDVPPQKKSKKSQKKKK